MGIRRLISDRDRAELIRSNWRYTVAGLALLFALGCFADGLYAGVGLAATYLFWVLVALAIGDRGF